MPNDPPPSLRTQIVQALASMPEELERSLVPVVDPSLAAHAEVAWVQGTLDTGTHAVRFHLLSSHALIGTVTIDLLADDGATLGTCSVRVLQTGARGDAFTVELPVDVAWPYVTSAKLSFVGT